MPNNRERGRWGENRAAEYLQSQGLRLLDRNWYCRYGELDLILQDGDTLVFAEVKLRKNARYAPAAQAVTQSKQRKLIYTAESWLQQTGCTAKARFDVIEIYASEDQSDCRIHWIPNAFEVT